MSTPEVIDREAEAILSREGYLWDAFLNAFRRIRQPRHESTDAYLQAGPVLITIEELEDHGLLRGQDLTPEQHRVACSWLRGIAERRRRQSGAIESAGTSGAHAASHRAASDKTCRDCHQPLSGHKYLPMPFGAHLCVECAHKRGNL